MHCIALGNHLIGRFTTKCAECDETAAHFFRDATFNSTGWYLCDLHCALYFLDEACTYAPDEIAEAVSTLTSHQAFSTVLSGRGAA